MTYAPGDTFRSLAAGNRVCHIVAVVEDDDGTHVVYWHWQQGKRRRCYQVHYDFELDIWRGNAPRPAEPK